jgi:hypothetical protein
LVQLLRRLRLLLEQAVLLPPLLLLVLLHLHLFVAPACWMHRQAPAAQHRNKTVSKWLCGALQSPERYADNALSSSVEVHDMVLHGEQQKWHQHARVA